MLSQSPESPRRLVIGLRSFTGSRVAFLDAAAALLKSSSALKLVRGSTIEIYAAQGATPGYMAAAVLMESSLSVAGLMGLTQAVEERLADPLHPGARQTLRADLMWVEGVEVKTPAIELPNPALFRESWAIGTFVEAGEEAVTSKIEAARFLHALKHVPPPPRHLPAHLCHADPKLRRLPDRDVWTPMGYDWLDGLADAAWVIAYAQTDIESGERDMREWRWGDLPTDLSGPVSRQLADRVVLVEATAAAPDDTAIATAWLRELHRKLIASSMRLSIPVVFSVDGGKIRGLAVGCDGTPPAAVRVIGIKAVADPAETRARALAVGRPNRPHIELEIDRSARDAQRPHELGPPLRTSPSSSPSPCRSCHRARRAAAWRWPRPATSSRRRSVFPSRPSGSAGTDVLSLPTAASCSSPGSSSGPGRAASWSSSRCPGSGRSPRRPCAGALATGPGGTGARCRRTRHSCRAWARSPRRSRCRGRPPASARSGWRCRRMT